MYERRLPLLDAIGQPLFVTFRLHGSPPPNRVFPPARLTSGQAFAAIDRLLDHSRTGPFHLRRPEIARLVIQALHDGENRFERLLFRSFVLLSELDMAVSGRGVTSPRLRRDVQPPPSSCDSLCLVAIPEEFPWSSAAAPKG
jgi:hypothetical protein